MKVLCGRTQSRVQAGALQYGWEEGATDRREGVAPKDIDLVLCGTITPEMAFPSTACFVAAALGMNTTPAFDIAAACSGWREMLESWGKLPIGGTLELVWVEADHGRKRRPAKRPRVRGAGRDRR